MVATHMDRATPRWDWLPDDTEESGAGSSLHQKAISILGDRLKSVRAEETGRERA